MMREREREQVFSKQRPAAIKPQMGRSVKDLKMKLNDVILFRLLGDLVVPFYGLLPPRMFLGKMIGSMKEFPKLWVPVGLQCGVGV